jgi:hypothetical protein
MIILFNFLYADKFKLFIFVLINKILVDWKYNTFNIF